MSSSAQLWLDQRRNWQPTKINIRSNVVWQDDTISNNNGGGLHPGAPDCQCHVASPWPLALVIRLFAMALDEASLRRYLDEAATWPHDSQMKWGISDQMVTCWDRMRLNIIKIMGRWMSFFLKTVRLYYIRIY